MLLFPKYNIHYLPNAIEFSLLDDNDNVRVGAINNDNFDAFKTVLQEIFCLNNSAVTEYHVEGALAKKIADKFKKRNQKLAEFKQKPNKVAVLSRYVSILAVGEHKDMNQFMNYTVYQLFDEFRRFELKSAFDKYFKARLAGAKDLQDPKDWMQDIHAEGQ